MKRLLAQIGITAFTVLAVAFYLSDTAVWVLLGVCAAAGAVFLLIRRTRRTVLLPVVALTAALCCAVHLAFAFARVYPVQAQYADADSEVSATLTEEPYRSYAKYYYRLETDSINGQPVREKLLLKTAYPIGIEPFDRISFCADILPTVNRYYLAKGYYLTVNTFQRNFKVQKAEELPLYSHVIGLRRVLRDAIERYLPPDCAALCKAIFVGDKYALDTDTRDSFRYAGASYFVVVSGLHFSILCMLFDRILRRLRVHRIAAAVLTVVLILLYMAVTGFQPSVVRSGVMMTVLVAGRAIRRIGDSYNSLGLAAIVCILVFNPYGVGDIGMILSFAATFAIITWSDPIRSKLSFKEPDRLWKRMVNAVTAVLSVSLAANILVFPISLCAFRGFSAVTLVASLVLYVPVWLILVLTLLLCLFGSLGPLRYVALLLSWPLYGCCRFVLWAVEGLASLPFAYIYVGDAFVYVWLNVTLLLALLVRLLRGKRRLLPYAATASAILFLCGLVITTAVRMDTLALTAYSCGEGMAVGFDCRGSLYLLSLNVKYRDAYALFDTLTVRYGSAELAVCAKAGDRENYSRLTDREFAISHCLLYDSGRDDDDGSLIPYAEGESYRLSDGVMLRVSHSGSMLLPYLEAGDRTVLVIPSGYPQKDIPPEWKNPDVIVTTRSAEAYPALCCDTLICCGGADIAGAAPDGMAGHYQHILYTCDGDVTVDLR